MICDTLRKEVVERITVLKVSLDVIEVKLQLEIKARVAI